MGLYFTKQSLCPFILHLAKLEHLGVFSSIYDNFFISYHAGYSDLQEDWYNLGKSCGGTIKGRFREEVQNTLLRNITDWSIMADSPNFYHFNITKTLQNGSRFCKTLVTRYNLPNYKASDQLKNHYGFWIYPPLWTSQLVAMLDDIGNTSITLAVQRGSPLSLHRKESFRSFQISNSKRFHNNIFKINLFGQQFFPPKLQDLHSECRIDT